MPFWLKICNPNHLKYICFMGFRMSVSLWSVMLLIALALMSAWSPSPRKGWTKDIDSGEDVSFLSKCLSRAFSSNVAGDGPAPDAVHDLLNAAHMRSDGAPDVEFDPELADERIAAGSPCQGCGSTLDGETMRLNEARIAVWWPMLTCHYCFHLFCRRCLPVQSRLIYFTEAGHGHWLVSSAVLQQVGSYQ